MISPCGGCDPHIAAAVVCYLSFFLSGCSFFLYWYWLSSYRDEMNPRKRYPQYEGDEGSDCDALEPQPIHQEEDDQESSINSYNAPSTSSRMLGYNNYEEEAQQEIRNISGSVEDNSIVGGGSISSTTSLDHLESGGDPFIINTISLPSGASGVGEDLDSIHVDPGGGIKDGEELEKCAISNNPYLNGDTYRQNVLWGVHGIFTNLFEAVLGAIFYSGLFENNLKTTLIWVVGFSVNFLLGNFLYFLLLFYCTNKGKRREMWLRWSLESAFNVAKDLYYIWVGVAFLNQLVQQTTRKMKH